MQEVTVKFASLTQRDAIESAVRDRVRALDDDATAELDALSLIGRQFAFVREVESDTDPQLSVTFVFKDTTQYDRAGQVCKHADDPNLKWLGHRLAMAVEQQQTPVSLF